MSGLYRSTYGNNDMQYYTPCLEWCVKALGLDHEDEKILSAVDDMIQHYEFARRLYLLNSAGTWQPTTEDVDENWEKTMDAISNKTSENYLFTALIGAFRFYDE